jgi:alpha-L-fucosidase
MKQIFVIILGLFLYQSILVAQNKSYTPDPDTLVQQRLDQWQDMKFGLLMHWGPYSQWGIVESWSICPEDLSWAAGGRKKEFGADYFDYVERYEALQTTFNPTQFDPARWAKAATKAGMKYVIFTTKHHDGFCMFDSKLTDYTVTDSLTPFSSNPRSNITREIFNAFRAEDFWVGAYFSKPDWHSNYYWWNYFPPVDRNPNYSIQKHPAQWENFVQYTHGQIKELTTEYGRVDILWLDGGWVRVKGEEDVNTTLTEIYEGSRWARNPQSQDIRMPELAAMARANQPGILVVDRDVPGPYQNYLTPEQHIPETGLPYPWETCMTMGGSWSYTPGDKYKSSDKLVEILADVVSKGGNLLLNIGPSPEGDFHPEAYQRLEDIGRWMAINSEAIYSTRPFSQFGQGDSIRFTQSKDGRTIYALLFNFPTSELVLHKLPKGKLKVNMLGYRKSLKYRRSGDSLIISVPAEAAVCSEYVWVLKLQFQD